MLAFAWDRERNQDIYVVPATGGAPVRLTTHPAADRSPTWSPDGRYIAFASRRDGNWELYLLEVATGALKRLTNHPHYDDAPFWSPDGRYLAFESMREGDLDIFVLDLASREVTPVTTSPAPDYAPAWSPDGRVMAFETWRDGNREIYLASPIGAFAPVNITRHPADDFSPSWTATGELIFFSDRSGHSQLYIQPLTPDEPPAPAGAAHAVPWPVGEDAAPVQLSPDGKRMPRIVQRRWGYSIVLQPLVSGELATSPFHSVEPIRDLDWTPVNVSLPSAAPPPPPAPPLFVERVDRDSPPYGFKDLPDVQAPNPRFSDRVDDSFKALRQRVLEETGYDFLGVLSDAWRPIDDDTDGASYRSWHKAGRAFDTRLDFRDAQGRNLLLVVKEEGEGHWGRQTFWRLYLRTARQDGSMGEPLKQAPWDFYARFEGGSAALEGGRRLPVPAGYYVDFTALAAEYGWERIPANDRPGFSWKTNWRAIDFWHFEKRDGLNWFQAMREVYDDETLRRYFGRRSLR